MSANESLDEQLVVQETAGTRCALADLRSAYTRRGIKLSEAAAVRMCIRGALPLLEAVGRPDLEDLVAQHAVLPGAPRDEPLDVQLVVQETRGNRDRLTELSKRYNDDGFDVRKGNDRLLEASAIRLCIAVALPGLLAELLPRAG